MTLRVPDDRWTSLSIPTGDLKHRWKCRHRHQHFLSGIHREDSQRAHRQTNAADYHRDWSCGPTWHPSSRLLLREGVTRVGHISMCFSYSVCTCLVRRVIPRPSSLLTTMRGSSRWTRSWTLCRTKGTAGRSCHTPSKDGLTIFVVILCTRSK